MYSCSINEETAIEFAESGTFMKIQTDYAIPFDEYSKYPDEKEYIIPPGMFFEVLDYEKNLESYDVLHAKLAHVNIVSSFRTDLALDISESYAKMRPYDPNSDKQVWFMQGRYIRNANTGYN